MDMQKVAEEAFVDELQKIAGKADIVGKLKNFGSKMHAAFNTAADRGGKEMPNIKEKINGIGKKINSMSDKKIYAIAGGAAGATGAAGAIGLAKYRKDHKKN